MEIFSVRTQPVSILILQFKETKTMLSDLNRKIIRSLLSLKLKDEIFSEMSKELGISSPQIVEVLLSLKDKGILRRWGIYLNSKELGYESALIALKIEENKLDLLNAWVSREPGITHCYSRRFAILGGEKEEIETPEISKFNIWFTLASKDLNSFQRKTKQIQNDLQLDSNSMLILSSQRKFKLRFDLV